MRTSVAVGLSFVAIWLAGSFFLAHSTLQTKLCPSDPHVSSSGVEDTGAPAVKEQSAEREDFLGPELANADIVPHVKMNWVPAFEDQTLTVMVLCRNEFASLKSSLETWHKGGLADVADEILIFLNAYNKTEKGKEFEPLTDMWSTWKTRPRVITSPVNVPIMTAIMYLVGNSTSRYVLFLEKDFQLTASSESMAQQIGDAKKLLARDAAHVVRFRSRYKPGDPNFAHHMYQGRELRMLQKQKNLMCNVYHWVEDPAAAFPEHLWRCYGQESWFCARAAYCAWTNNPQMYAREWFMRSYYRTLLHIQHLSYPDNDMEYYFNWAPHSWNTRAFVVALPDGLFTHVETGEHPEPDFTCMREDDIAAARREALPAGGWKQPNVTIGIGEMPSRLDAQLTPAKVKDWFAPAQSMADDLARVADRIVDVELVTPGPQMAQPHIGSNITLVTGFWDIGRGRLETGARAFREYIDAVRNVLLQKNMPKIIFVDPAVVPELRDRLDNLTYIVEMPLNEVRLLVGIENTDAIKRIRVDPEWAKDWLPKSPQGSLDDYNTVVMAKLPLLDRAAQLNPFGTPYMVWIDAKHTCDTACRFKDENMGLLYEHMAEGVFAASWNYGPAPEVHGFRWKELNGFMGRDADDASAMTIVKGGILGGSVDSLIALNRLFVNTLKATLEAGFMGVEENVLMIIQNRYPNLFRLFHQNDACAESTLPDKACPGFRNPDNVCAPFTWMLKGPPSKGAAT